MTEQENRKEMAVDAVNDEELEYTFTAYEIDLDYEFDAARFFDFERDESLPETRRAELWFDSAGSYPPSPFVEKLVSREEVLKENVNISPKSKGVDSMNLPESNSDVEAEHEISAMDLNYGGRECKGPFFTVHIASQQKFQNGSEKLLSGLTFYNHMVNNANSENQTKVTMKKPKVPRTSTLMKPTASQLAKQNRPFQAGYSRSQTSMFEKISKNSANTCVVENQAAKRQKLDGGLQKKVMGTVQLQQTNFVHKAPKKDGFIDGNLINTKPRITIPKDPDLETAHRALRAKSSKDNATSTVRRFKALPLNKKILEAPSLLPKRTTPRLPDFQEFQLKTSERAMQHSSAVLKSAVPCNHSDKDLHKYKANLTMDCGIREPGRSNTLNNASKPDGCQISQSFKALPFNKKIAQSFKALPFNKKIFTSKGDIGMYRNIKKEATVPMEFNFHREKRFHDNPPVELFNKLSLASETRVSDSETKVPRSISISTKGSKENRWGSFQQGYEVKQPGKLRPPLLEEKLLSRVELTNEISIASDIKWSNTHMH